MQEIAKEARAKLNNLYAEKRDHLKPRGSGRNLISEEMSSYFYSGMAFDDAEALVEEMGGKISKRGRNLLLGNSPLAFSVIGEIEINSSFPTKTVIVFTLIPTDQNKYDTVQKVEIEFVINAI
ncbi:hypothetical protein GCM10025770_36320 [Viridibacterium curvum]|uniref:BRCT domain-containing protein n=2 Tax=Viridibacterium curvum TaxID=1101404 RepID=A0ABP9R487_9RHOO